MDGEPTLHVRDSVPPGLLDCHATELYTILPGPTLLHLPGARPEPLFVSTLLHGNETSGLVALQALLRKHRGRELPRALSVFIGNVAAARSGLRRLDGQPDYNRVWPGGEDQRSPEAAIARDVLEAMRPLRPFASIDIHTTTGRNPHYSCSNQLDPRFLYLASLFSRIVVYSIRPDGVLTNAFAEICPAITIECGPAGERAGAELALGLLERGLALAELPDAPLPEKDIDLYHTVATVTVPEMVSFGFGVEHADLSFREDLDLFNFREIPAGTPLARLRAGAPARLVVANEWGQDVTSEFLVETDGELCTRRALTPSLITLDERIIRQDCLGYFMERLSHTPA